jgi:thiamine-phosphate pyrophosphorylase
MGRRYSAAMPLRQTCPEPRRRAFPDLWLISDERNDAALEGALRRLPRGSGFIYRHYHLPDAERIARWFALRRIARARGHVLVLADSALTAREWGADGIYGAPRALYPTSGDLLTLATAHDLADIAAANHMRADAVLLSPVFPTRSHPGAAALGPARFRLLAAHAQMPVIALGGMTPHTARRLAWPRWAAIDGLSG